MEKAKKILMIISLSALAVACIMLILAVFKVPVFQGVPLRLLLIFSTIAVACGMSITELSVIKRKKVLGYVAIALLGLSTLLAMIIFCSNLLTQYSVFNIITSIVKRFICSDNFALLKTRQNYDRTSSANLCLLKRARCDAILAYCRGATL